MHKKQYYRDKVKRAFEQVKQKELERRSSELVKRVLQVQLFRAAQTVMAYLPLRDEVDLRPLFKAEKQFYVPLVEGKKIVPVRLFTEERISGEELDLVIVPGRAFTKDGIRIGRGYGLYDRFIASFNPVIPTVALAFFFQVFEQLPVEKHDATIDKVLVG